MTAVASPLPKPSARTMQDLLGPRFLHLLEVLGADLLALLSERLQLLGREILFLHGFQHGYLLDR